MTDIVERLREVAVITTGLLYSRRKMLNEAADEIELLRHEAVKRLKTLTDANDNSARYCAELASMEQEIKSLLSRAEKAEAELSTMTISRDGYAKQSAARAEECDRIRDDLLHSEGFIQRLQKALAFWMPGVGEKIEVELDGRASDDAGLLAGFKGEAPLLSWGDLTIDRAEKAEAARDKALDRCIYLAGLLGDMTIHDILDDRASLQATCEKLAKALEQAEKEAGKATSKTHAVAVSACQRIADIARLALSTCRKEASE